MWRPSLDTVSVKKNFSHNVDMKFCFVKHFGFYETKIIFMKKVTHLPVVF